MNISDNALYALKQLEYFVNETMGIKTFKQSGWHIEGTDNYELVKEALQRLEAIEKSNPSEAIKCLEELGEIETDDINCEDIKLKDDNDFKDYYNTIKNTLLKAQKQEKVLDIIKKKCINNHNLEIVAISDNYSVYCAWFANTYSGLPIERYELIEEEFDLLKGWSKND